MVPFAFSAHERESGNYGIEARQHMCFAPPERRQPKRHESLLQFAKLASAQSQVTSQIKSAVRETGPAIVTLPIFVKLLAFGVNLSSKIKQRFQELPMTAQFPSHILLYIRRTVLVRPTLIGDHAPSRYEVRRLKAPSRATSDSVVGHNLEGSIENIDGDVDVQSGAEVFAVGKGDAG